MLSNRRKRNRIIVASAIISIGLIATFYMAFTSKPKDNINFGNVDTIEIASCDIRLNSKIVLESDKIQNAEDKKKSAQAHIKIAFPKGGKANNTPEPATMILLGLGGAGLLSRKKRKARA